MPEPPPPSTPVEPPPAPASVPEMLLPAEGPQP
jgi:phospholipid/cholesterol/gamma-HCH transport system substrate-binding protein